MTARDELYGLISRLAMTDSADWHDDVQKHINAYRDVVRAEDRTTWPTAAELQQAAVTKRASGTAEDVAVANLLNSIANALAWLAPYRTHEGGYEMWGAATTLAQLINGTTLGDDRCPTCECIDPDCTSCTGGNCRNDDADELVSCSHSRCPNGERHAKATERGWTHHHMDTWRCPKHPPVGAA